MPGPTQTELIAEARALLAFIRTNREWFASNKMIEPYESEAVAKLARFLDGQRGGAQGGSVRPYPEPRMRLMGHYGGWRSRLLRLWQEWQGFHTEIATETLGPWCLELPWWPWRPVCWIQGHVPEPNEWAANRGRDSCIVCGKDLSP